MPVLDLAGAWLTAPGPGGLWAYIGPGAGLEFVGYFFTLAVYGLTAASAVLLWPVYALVRRLRGSKKPAAAAPPAAAPKAPEPSGAPT